MTIVFIKSKVKYIRHSNQGVFHEMELLNNIFKLNLAESSNIKQLILTLTQQFSKPVKFKSLPKPSYLSSIITALNFSSQYKHLYMYPHVV